VEDGYTERGIHAQTHFIEPQGIIKKSNRKE